MIQYHEMLRHILDNGTSHNDRTGVGTTSVFGYQNRYNLQDGFPLVTTKKISLRWIAEELFFFLSGSTSETDLRNRCKNPITIWEAWRDENGELGPVYGRQWRSFGSFDLSRPVRVEPRYPTEFSDDPCHNYKLYIPSEEDKYEIVSDAFIIDGTPYVKLKFKSGFIRDASFMTAKSVSGKNMKGSYKDPYSRTVCKQGYVGEPDRSDNMFDKLYSIWASLLNRCYNKNDRNYDFSGAKGATVCERWKCFANFQRDVKLMAGWDLKRLKWNEYHINRHHFSSDVFSPETCIWVPNSVVNAYSHRIPFIATSPDGIETEHAFFYEFCNEIGIKPQSAYEVMNGRRPSIKGWKFRKTKENFLRASCPVDQIRQVVEQIQNEPNSRRIILSAWNPPDVPDMALAPCHVMVQLKVDNGTLHCQLYQRSADSFLGVPYNIASYALLTHMIAHVCGLQVGDFIHTFGDLHIYNNHIDQVNEQLSRDVRPLPTLTLNERTYGKGYQGLMDINWSDILLPGYDPHPSIKAEVAV